MHESFFWEKKYIKYKQKYLSLQNINETTNSNNQQIKKNDNKVIRPAIVADYLGIKKSKKSFLDKNEKKPNFPLLSKLEPDGNEYYCFDFDSIDIINPDAFPVGFIMSPHHLSDYIIEKDAKTAKHYWKKILRHPEYERYVTLNNEAKPLVIFINHITKHLIVYDFDEKKYKNKYAYFIENVENHIMFDKYQTLSNDIQNIIINNVHNNYCLPHDKLVLEITYEKIFIGDDSEFYSPQICAGVKGNTILAKIKGLLYMSFCQDIITFEAPEEIINYYSQMGNNTVPYPVAETKNYLIFHSVYVNKKYFKNKNYLDAFYEYYGHSGNLEPKKHEKIIKNYKIFWDNRD